MLNFERVRGFLSGLAKNTLWLFLTRVTNQGLLMITTILVARSLGETGLGRYAFITSVVLVGNTLTTFGTDTLLIREVARDRKRSSSLASEALILQLLLSCVFVLALMYSSSLIRSQQPETIYLLKVYSLSLFPMAFFSVFSALLRAHERMDLYFLLNLALSSAQLALFGWVLVNKGDISGLIIVSFLVQVIASCLAFWLYWTIDPGFGIRASFLRQSLLRIVKLAWPLALLTGLTISIQRLGVIGLSLLGDDRSAGWFTAAMRLLEGFKFLHYAVLGALLPVLSRYSNELGEPANQSIVRSGDKSILRNTLAGLLIISIVSAIFIHFTSRALIHWLYGSSFEPAANSLSILAWSLVPYACSSVLSLKLIVEGREKVVLKIYIAILVTTAAGYMLLVPRYGLAGASLVWLTGETTQTSLFFMVNRGLRGIRIERLLPREIEASSG